MCNPFYDSDNIEKKPITSKKFIREVKRIGESWVPASAAVAAAAVSTGGAASGGGAGAGELVARDTRRDTVV